MNSTILAGNRQEHFQLIIHYYSTISVRETNLNCLQFKGTFFFFIYKFLCSNKWQKETILNWNWNFNKITNVTMHMHNNLNLWFLLFALYMYFGMSRSQLFIMLMKYYFKRMLEYCVLNKAKLQKPIIQIYSWPIHQFVESEKYK